jgi:hypothetical protein
MSDFFRLRKCFFLWHWSGIGPIDKLTVTKGATSTMPASPLPNTSFRVKLSKAAPARAK